MVETVQLFITCILDTLYPEIGNSVLSVLRRVGLSVEFPHEQTCCGQPAFNAGMRTQASRLAKHTIEVFENTIGPIVIPSGSCTAMIRYGYQELFVGEPGWQARAQALSERCFEFTEFLVDKLGITDLGASYSGTLAYHASCHLRRELGVHRQPLALLAEVKDTRLVELPGVEECCGFGGVFSVEQPEISAAMLERKIKNIQASGANTVVSCDAGCLTNINGGLHRRGYSQRVLHIAEILAGDR